MDVCGVDYLEHGRAEWKTEDATSSGFSRGVARGAQSTPPDAPPGRRFAVVYHLLSISLNQRLRLRVFCADDAQPMVDSVTGIWAGGRLVRARGVRSVRHPLQGPSGSAPPAHRLRLHRPSVSQGLSAVRQRRSALRPGEGARGVPAGEHRTARARAEGHPSRQSLRSRADQRAGARHRIAKARWLRFATTP